MSLSRQSPCSRRKNQRRRRQGWPCAPLGPPEAKLSAGARGSVLNLEATLEGSLSSAVYGACGAVIYAPDGAKRLLAPPAPEICRRGSVLNLEATLEGSLGSAVYGACGAVIYAPAARILY